MVHGMWLRPPGQGGKPQRVPGRQPAQADSDRGRLRPMAQPARQAVSGCSGYLPEPVAMPAMNCFWKIM